MAQSFVSSHAQVDGVPLWTANVAATLAEQACALPSVATTDWCDRAATVLAQVGENLATLFVAGKLDSAGKWEEVEACGVGSSAPREAEPVRISQPPSPVALFLEELRCNGAALMGQHWSPGGAGGTLLGPSAAVVPTGGWRIGPFPFLWGSYGNPAGFAAGAPLEPASRRRCIVAYLASMDASRPLSTWQACVLQATMGVLARKAGLAMGGIQGSGAWLSSREQQVLEQLILGKSVRQIAEDIGRSHHTVHDHVKSLHRKLGASSRGELIGRALGFGVNASTHEVFGKPGSIFKVDASDLPPPSPAQAQSEA